MSFILKNNGEQVAISGGWNPHLFASHTGTSYPASVGQDYQWQQDGWHLLWEDDPAPEATPPTQAELVALYEAKLDEHLDAVAQQRRYDNRVTCALRAGYPGPYQAEGQVFAVWMDTCNAQAYQIMVDVMQGNRSLPTIEDFIAELPVIQWP